MAEPGNAVGSSSMKNPRVSDVMKIALDAEKPTGALPLKGSNPFPGVEA